MKNMKVKTYHSRRYLKQKLVSATAMLLVASTMMVSVSYAWYVMSTAPEVSNIKTQVGANGALEIALLDENSWNNLTLLDSGDIDESVTTSTKAANLTWGNLVDLSDSSYGFNEILLQPSRLYIENSGNGDDGTTTYTVNQSLLKVPVYGEDGRIQSLTTTGVSALTYNAESKSFSTDAHGVRAIGTSANMSQFQLGMNTARSLLTTYMSSARVAASKALSDNGNALASIAAAYALESKTEGYTKDDIKTVKSLAEGLSVALDDLELALKQAFAGYITTAASEEDQGEDYDYDAALAEIDSLSLSDLMTKYPKIATVIPNMAAYITELNADIGKVDGAISTCNTNLAGEKSSFTWPELVAILSPLVDPNNMTLGGMTLSEIKGKVTGSDGTIDKNAAVSLASQLMTSDGLVIGVPSNTGVLADIADYAGDYTASVTITGVSFSGVSLDGQKAKISTQTSANPVYLTDCGNRLRNATVLEADGSNAMTDFYGYAIDLAFRTNASGSKLKLQTDSVNRVYEDDTSSSSLQGGGSYMKFTTNSTTMSATKMIKLMSAIRVVLMDENQNILGIATLDTTLVQSNYTLIKSTDTDNSTNANTDAASDETEDGGASTTTNTASGNSTAYAYLDIGGGYQPSDVISKEEYDKLSDGDSVVTIDKANRTISAKLYLHEFTMTVSTQHTQDEITNDNNGNPYYTGGITILGKKADQSITALTEDEAKIVTAMVYLDGSTVTNATVSADSYQSLVGTLNLQFSSDATLIPAENNALRNIGSSSVTYTQAAAAGETYTFGEASYTVNEGYTIYSGSDGNVYYRKSDETDYTQLTTENVLTSLTVSSTMGSGNGTEQSSDEQGTT